MTARDLLRRLRAIAEAPESELVPYPPRAQHGPGRPTPEVEELADRLKAVRNRRADELDLPRGTLLANAVLLDLARAAPQTLDELMDVDGVRRWKADVLGEDLLAAIRRG